MKLSRLLAYGIAGVVSGLILENTYLQTKEKARNRIKKIDKKLKKGLHATH